MLARVLNRANLDGLGGDDVYWRSERLARDDAPELPRRWPPSGDRLSVARAGAPRTASASTSSTSTESSQPMQASVMLWP